MNKYHNDRGGVFKRDQHKFTVHVNLTDNEHEKLEDLACYLQCSTLSDTVRFALINEYNRNVTPNA